MAAHLLGKGGMEMVMRFCCEQTPCLGSWEEGTGGVGVASQPAWGPPAGGRGVSSGPPPWGVWGSGGSWLQWTVSTGRGGEVAGSSTDPPRDPLGPAGPVAMPGREWTVRETYILDVVLRLGLLPDISGNQVYKRWG